MRTAGSTSKEPPRAPFDKLRVLVPAGSWRGQPDAAICDGPTMGERMRPAREERPAEAAESAGADGGAYTYIVECSDGTLYTGWAKDVQARVQAHNAGRGARYTRGRRPVRLRYYERHPDRRAAMRRERKMKRLSRRQKLALIARFRGRGKPDL